MNSIKDLLPGSMRERTFQLKARRDAGAAWNDPQFVECKKCGRRATRQIWNKAQYVCPNCGVHLPIGGYYRLSLILDKGSFRELDADLAPQDVLQFPGYPEKLEAQTGKTGLKDGTMTPGRNFFVRGANLKVLGEDESVGVTLTNTTTKAVVKLDEDMITKNNPSELTLLIPADLADGDYLLTVRTQFGAGKHQLKEPREVSVDVHIGDGGNSDRPEIE